MLDNVVFFLKPKDQVQLLYGMMSIQQGLDAMQEAHYTAMPVINQKGQYLGTLSEGDFLWHHLEHPHNMDLEIEKLIRKDFVPACTIDTNIDDLFQQALDQNFVPIVDDRNIFIGIVTRKSILSYLMQHNGENPKEN